MRLYYTYRSSNRKTGDIPHQWIGGSTQEAKATCQGCPLLKGTKRNIHSKSGRIRRFGLRCYAHYGHTAVVHRHIIKAAKRQPWKYKLLYALFARLPTTKYFRFAANADPSGIARTTFMRHYNKVKSHGLAVICYTHFPHKAPWLKGKSLASADSLDQAIELVKQGWRVAVHLPTIDKPKMKIQGFNLVQCLHELGKAQCSNCGLCVAENHSNVHMIGFTDK